MCLWSAAGVARLSAGMGTLRIRWNQHHTHLVTGSLEARHCPL